MKTKSFKSGEEFKQYVLAEAAKIISAGNPTDLKMNSMDKLANSDGAALVKTKEKGGFEKKTEAPVNTPEEFTKVEEPTEVKMNKNDKDQGHDEKIATAVEVEAAKTTKKGGNIEGQHDGTFTSKKDNPKVTEDNDPTQAGGKPGITPEMNSTDKLIDDGTKTMVTAGAELNKGFNTGQKKAVAHEKAENEKETLKMKVDAVQLPESFKTKKDLLEFIEKESRRLAKELL